MMQSAKYLGLFLAGLCLLSSTAVTGVQAQPDAEARAVKEQPRVLLSRAREVMRADRLGGSVIHYRAAAAVEQNYQSDRSYPPFFSAMQTREAWFEPQTGAERASTQSTFPGNGPLPAQLTLTDGKRAFSLAKEKPNLLPRTAMLSRYLNPWAVVADWIAAGDARFVGREVYRDYPRLVLVRLSFDGEQRLFVDPKSGFPVKLDFYEQHYLWGQRHIEYVYSNWNLSAGIMMAGSVFKLTDGETEISQTIGNVELVAKDSAPSFSLPETPALASNALPVFLQPIEPKVVPVSSQTYLLVNPGYTEAVTQIGEEVFLFDATQGEERAKKDAAAIAKIFPGKHRITLVVTDLAWPHIAGLRYWVANGAIIVAHKSARQFLQTVIDRRWTVARDLLEQRRKTARLKFVGIDAPYELARGRISLHPVDGIGSEVALIAYVVSDRFLWASDYIQTIDEPTSYALEVLDAVRRDKLKPELTAAQHLPLTRWTKIEELQK